MYFRKVAKEVEKDLVLALAFRQKYTRDASQFLFAPQAAKSKGARPPWVLSVCVTRALGIIWMLSCVAKGTA